MAFEHWRPSNIYNIGTKLLPHREHAVSSLRTLSAAEGNIQHTQCGGKMRRCLNATARIK